MATPCTTELAQSPFQTYRDPITGEWRVKHENANPRPKNGELSSNVIPFPSPTISPVAQHY